MKPHHEALGATIVITSVNSELLKLCKSFIPAGVDVFVIDGRDGRYGMQAIAYAIEHAPGDRAILLDEDAFILNFSRLRGLLEWAVESGSACIGMSDGGVLPIRQHNPNAMNPFFNVLDLGQVRRLWNPAEVRAMRRAGSKMAELWPPEGILTPGVPYEFDDFESYYCFYFWLREQGLRLDWLTGRTHVDGISTILHDRSREPFLVHAWYGRRFGRDPLQTDRILKTAVWAAATAQREAQ
jgi:hypothetical protein